MLFFDDDDDDTLSDKSDISRDSIHVYNIQHQQIHLICSVQKHHTLYLHKQYITSYITYTIHLRLSHPTLNMLYV